MSRICACILLMIVAVVLFNGCTKNPYIKISGKVTMEGEPLDNGGISFMPLDDGQPTGGGLIESDGKYTAEVGRGKYQVSIISNRPLKTPKTGELGIPITAEQFIPVQYNEQTTLTIDTNSGLSFDFSLTQ